MCLKYRITASRCQLVALPDKALKQLFQVDIRSGKNQDATVHIINASFVFKMSTIF
jgi:hypothetical protein